MINTEVGEGPFLHIEESGGGRLTGYSAPGMEGEGASKTLPEDLVEKIVAMVPFPSLFKARVLSKSWLSKFSSISSQDDEEEQNLATSFHKQVSLWSNTWETFCPVFVGKENFLAFDRASHSWRRMSSLSYLPENLVLARVNLRIEGALLYGFALPETRSRKKELYVTNILTRSWKQLPPRPNAGTSVVLCHKLVSVKSETYKMIMFCREDHHGQLHRYSAQIYDSKSDAWSSKKLTISSDFFKTSTVYLNGILYMVADTNPRDLLAFNVKEGTLEEFTLAITIDSIIVDNRIVSVNLVVCKASLMMIVTVRFHVQNQLVLEIDLDSRRVVEVARGAPDSLGLGDINTQPVSDGNCIFLGVEECTGRILGVPRNVLAYNLQDDEWTSFPAPAGHTSSADRRYKWIPSAFRPGLVPFVAV